MGENVEALKKEIQRLARESFDGGNVGRPFTAEDINNAMASYKRNLEQLGCTNVRIAISGLVHDEVGLDVHFTPPQPTFIDVKFAVEWGSKL